MRARPLALIAALTAALLFAPAPAAARVTVTVEIAYGGVVVGGVGFFVYIAGSWEYPLAGREIPTALLEVRGDGCRWGVPLPQPRLAPGEGAGAAADGALLDLVRVRF